MRTSRLRSGTPENPRSGGRIRPPVGAKRSALVNLNRTVCRVSQFVVLFAKGGQESSRLATIIFTKTNPGRGRPGSLSKSVHRQHIVRQGQDEFTFAGGYRAGERAPAQYFYRSIVGEGEVVVSGAQGFGIGLQLFVAADEFYGVDFRGCPGSAAEQDEEIGVAVLRGFAQVDRTQVLEFGFVLGDGGVGFGIASSQ